MKKNQLIVKNKNLEFSIFGFSVDGMNKMINSLETEENKNEDLAEDRTVGINKRLTVDFMGMQVSYPQYLRLIKLQEKVVKLNQVI